MHNKHKADPKFLIRKYMIKMKMPKLHRQTYRMQKYMQMGITVAQDRLTRVYTTTITDTQNH